MMNQDMLSLTLAALALAIALNLKLTLAVLRSARRSQIVATPLQPGDAVPDINATTLAGARRLRLAQATTAQALLFLSSQCPKCRDQVARIAALAGPAQDAGLALWIVSDESRWRLQSLLRGTALAANTVRVHRRDYRLVNPIGASPAYLFVNHQGTIDAAGLIGDGNWRDLEAQLTMDGAGEYAA